MELNRRLAPEVYLGVVAIVERDEHLEIVEAPREDEAPLEWAVHMQRLPESRTLEARLASGDLPEGLFERLGTRLADFHAEAEQGEEIAEYGRFEVVADNARDNYEQSRDHVGTSIHPDVFERLETLNERTLQRQQSLIEQRADERVPCDTHGDLRLDHVYLFPEHDPPRDLVIVDCIEFNPAFRYADPVSDMAFLTMDLLYHGHRDRAERFVSSYFESASDPEGRELLDVYVAYRAAVRGKVEGIRARESEVPEQERREAARAAAGQWLLALGQLEVPRHRPALVLIGGLPGTGKSTLAEALANRANAEVIDSDVVRKELAGLDADESGGDDLEEGIYTEAWSERTYEACLERVEDALFRGERVVVEASFRDAARRRRFLEAARTLGVPGVFMICEASDETVRTRLASRTDDVSDADWEVYQHMADAWEPVDSAIAPLTERIDTEGTPDATAERALETLRARDLL